MKIVNIISEHKENHKRIRQQGEPVEWTHRTKIGHAECIVEIDGRKVTRHIPFKENL
jgi:hypothetical protein